MTVSPAPDPALAPEIRWCSRCRAALEVREVAGRPRKACPACGHIHFVEPKIAAGVCVERDQRILLVKRRFSPGKGQWSIPAGYLDIGDEPASHAIREVKEETGLDVTITGIVDVFHNPPGEGGAAVFILYRGVIAGGSLQAGDDAVEADFFGPDELPELAFASTRHAVGALARRTGAAPA